MRRSSCLLLLSLGPLLRFDVAAADVGPSPRYYDLDTSREAALLVGGGILLGTAYWLQSKTHPFDEDQVAELEGTSLHGGFLGIDTSARRRWSPEAARASDVTLRLTQLGPLLQALGTEEDTGTLLLMYGETFLLTSATNQPIDVGAYGYLCQCDQLNPIARNG